MICYYLNLKSCKYCYYTNSDDFVPYTWRIKILKYT